MKHTLRHISTLMKASARPTSLLPLRAAAWAVVMSLLPLATACIDDDIQPCPEEGATLADDEFGLCIDLNLGLFPSVESTRSSIDDQDYNYGSNTNNPDNYINFAKSWVVVFDKQNNYLFRISGDQLKRADVTQKIDVGDYEGFDSGNYEDFIESDRYRVRIRVSDVLTDWNHDAVWQALRYDGFKIAFLANWPGKDLDIRPGDKLSRISHLVKDDTYTGTSSSSSNPAGTPAEFYKFLVEDGKMGASQTWITNVFKDEEDAAKFIRTQKPEQTSTQRISIDKADLVDTSPEIYGRMWWLWNFGGGVSSEGGKNTSSDLKYPGFVSEWLSLSGNSFKNMSTGAVNNQTVDELTIKNATLTENNGNYGMLIKGDVTDAFTVNAYADGTAYVKCEVKKHTTDGKWKLVTEHGDKKITRSEATLENKSGIQIISAGIRNINGGKEAAKIYFQDSSNKELSANDEIIIYEIEFVEDRHLYLTYRYGRYPQDTDEKGISMYGIQEFPPLDGYWESGKWFHLFSGMSEDTKTAEWTRPKNAYPGIPTERQIYLLRSVARLDFYIYQSVIDQHGGATPAHVFFRSLNRSSRCEPIDVYTPTEQIWWNREKEFKNICTFGPFYQNTDDLAKYRNMLGWFYWCWKDLSNWNWNGMTISWLSEAPAEYPHIMNSYINRSDFDRFRWVNQETVKEDGYYHYVLYLPEKNIDDPTTVGSLKATPKVPHIEFRFTDTEYTNLEDENCWRIYLYDYNSGEKIPMIEEDLRGKWPTTGNPDWGKWEEDTEQTGKLWPIMRNHVYRFDLRAGETERFDVQFTVCGPDNRTVTIPDYE